MKLSYKLAMVIIAVTTVAIVVLGLLFSTYASKIITSRISDQLISISTLKENQLNNYIDRSENELEGLAIDSVLVEAMAQFHAANESTDPDSHAIQSHGISDISNMTEMEETSEKEISAHFDSILNHSEFSSFSVLTADGIVDLSTIPDEVGKIKSKEKYFINGLNSTYVQNFYISISSREPAMTIATPIIDAKGNVAGVLTGDVRLDQISNIMTERSGLGDTGETLIVNKNHLLLSESRFITDIAFKKTIYTQGFSECLAGDTGVKKYKDYRDVDIIGYYIWIPSREICLVTKIDVKEAYSSLNILYLELIFFGVLLLGSSLLIAYIFSRRFTKPLGALVEGTEQWSKGNLNHTVPITSNDEIAVLCKAFNDASQEMLRSRALEKNYTSDLKKELDRKTEDMMRSLEELEQSKKASLNIMDDLSESNKHLQDLDKAKTDFLNVASHELKTPLTAISAYLEILDDYKGQFNAEQLHGLDAIKRNSNQLKMLIGNILEISRLDSGRFDLNISEVDIKEKVSSLVENLKILSENKHIELKYDCDGVGIISTDAMRFEEILNNLVGNAIKFTDAGSVTVKTEWGEGKEKGFIVVSVIDTGVGIPEDKIGSLFQKFYQVDATVSRRYGGTGLGLSITKKMIEIQGGKISVSSVVGKGTTFKFTLPTHPSKKSVSKVNSTIISADGLYTTAGTLAVDNSGTKNDTTGSETSIKEITPEVSDSSHPKSDQRSNQRKSKNRSKKRSNPKLINRHIHNKR